MGISCIHSSGFLSDLYYFLHENFVHKHFCLVRQIFVSLYAFCLYKFGELVLITVKNCDFGLLISSFRLKKGGVFIFKTCNSNIIICYSQFYKKQEPFSKLRHLKHLKRIFLQDKISSESNWTVIF